MPERRVPCAAGVVLASGSGTRVGAAVNKVFLPLGGRRVVSWSLRAFSRVPGIGVLVLVARPQDAELVEWVLGNEVDGASIEVVHGGVTRQESELRALHHLGRRIDDGVVDTVLLHDAARPLVKPELITAVLEAAREHGSAVPGLAADDIVEVGDDGHVAPGQRFEGAITVQTPQGFAARPLLAAYEEAKRAGFLGTDTASCMERFSTVPVRWVDGAQENFKITYPDDLAIAERIAAAVG